MTFITHLAAYCVLVLFSFALGFVVGTRYGRRRMHAMIVDEMRKWGL